jgi:hypothetical protein
MTWKQHVLPVPPTFSPRRWIITSPLAVRDSSVVPVLRELAFSHLWVASEPMHTHDDLQKQSAQNENTESERPRTVYRPARFIRRCRTSQRAAHHSVSPCLTSKTRGRRFDGMMRERLESKRSCRSKRQPDSDCRSGRLFCASAPHARPRARTSSRQSRPLYTLCQLEGNILTNHNA